MFGIMSYSTFKLVLLFLVCPLTLQQTLPPKAVNAERVKLLKDALSWMTFKKNGVLASDQDLEPFFGLLKDRYLTSKYYKTLIIAFSRGVLPKLTLKGGAACDPAYTLEYRDSHNNSVTDRQLKNFTIGSYDKQYEPSRQFCDSREGLVCNKQTSKCECPQGTKLEPISQGSAVSRCLAQENEVCSLIDLDHDPTSNYETFKKYLPVTVLNLEKPVSCKMGTQCRFKSTDQTTPRCYPVNSGPWDKGRWDIDFGEECTLGLYADTGQCRVKPRSGPDILSVVFPGYTCFNFGPRSKPKSPHVGICAHDVGSYSISQTFESGDVWYYDLQMIGFVSPATTPLRGKALYDYYLAYTNKLWTQLTIYTGYQEDATSIARSVGSRCNVEKTEKMMELWKFFKNLEDTPPPGKDYLATEAELQTKFNETEALLVDLKKRICWYRSEKYSESPTKHALKCVSDRHTDINGNNGKCEEIPENEDVTFSWAKLFFEYRDHISKTDSELRWEDTNYRRDIYEPELECDPKLGPPPGSQGAAPSIDSSPLEGGYCPPDRGCYQEYDLDDIFHSRNCSLKDDIPRLWLVCQDLSDNRRYKSCEEGHLNYLFGKEVHTLTSYAGLKRGDACQYDLEVKFRDWVEHGAGGGNKYKKLIEIYKLKNGIGGASKLCDRTQLLECSKSGTCECISDYKPREVVLQDGVTYYSDHCYLTSGNCKTDSFGTLRDLLRKSTQAEKGEIDRHYKRRDHDTVFDGHCEKANWCVFLKSYSCTTENTGTTGFEGDEPVTTTTTAKSTTATGGGGRTTTDKDDESHLVCQGEKCGWQDAGGAQKEINVFLKIIVVFKIINVIV